MGIILSRVRKKKSAEETLEKLQNDIKEIEENKTHAQLRYKKITKLFLICSLGLYLICGIVLYFHFDSTLNEKLLYLVPLALSPLLLYLVKRVISWYYVRLINKNQSRLNEMKKEKKRILDEVMDKETYKVAKQILEKYSGETVPKVNPQNLRLAPISQSNEGLKKRIVNTSNSQRPNFPKPIGRSFAYGQQPQSVNSDSTAMKPVPGMAPQMRLPAPILPLQRSYVDKVVEYLIGDGPNNRYALICSRCHSHNGMALKEEFEYIGFKCCYCFFYNPARKLRPEAPKLEISRNLETDSDSDSKSSGSNSDEEIKAILDSNKGLGENCAYENTKSSKPDEKLESTNPESNSTDELINSKDETLIEEKEKEIMSENYDENSITKEAESDPNCDDSAPKS